MNNRITKSLLGTLLLLSCSLTLSSCDILMMALMMGVQSGTSVPTNTTNTTSSSTSPFSSNIVTDSTIEANNYLQQYQNLVNRFQERLKSLNQAKRSGLTYPILSHSSALRGYQQEMRNIRQEAHRKGIFIQQAPQETMNF